MICYTNTKHKFAVVIVNHQQWKHKYTFAEEIVNEQH